jgi:hypothetical protein
VLNPANINRGANHLAEGETVDSLTTREKVRLSVNEWRIIKTDVEHANTNKLQQKYAFRVSLRPKAAGEVTSKGED